ncbi:MAG: suppressor of fused domain protein [Aquaticitalea sp.]
MKNWGMPEYRNITSKGKHSIELYSFPEEHFTRFATIGISSATIPNSEQCNSEIVMVIPKDVASAQTNEIKNYIFDIAVYLVETLGHNLTAEDMIQENDLAPKGWPKALIFEEPRGENEELSFFHVGHQHIELFWVIPIHGAEYTFIRNGNIEKFDDIIERKEIEITDVRRKSCI